MDCAYPHPESRGVERLIGRRVLRGTDQQIITIASQSSHFLRLPWVHAASWSALIILLTLTPGSIIPAVPSWMDLLSWDKLIHFALFATQTILLARIWVRVIPKPLIASSLSAFLGMVFGAMIEILQANLPIGRSGNVYDFIADSIGCVLGMLIFLRMTRFNE